MSDPRLPVLDTVSFDDCLPLAYLPDASPQHCSKALLETRLALTVLASSGDTSEAGAALLRLEAKLDLALELALQARHPDTAPATPCRTGLESVAWWQTQALATGSSGLLAMQANPPSALSLQLPVRIATCQAVEGGYVVVATWGTALGQAQADWERWVFRRHRQAIGRKA